MCGIVGYISTDDKVHPMAKRHFSDYALMLDTLRGSDSTGIIRVNNEFDVHVTHTTASGRKFVHTEEYDKWMDEFDGWCMIGHNRAATAGSVKLENAHPFTFGEVTMVHNGTLYNKGASVPGFDPKLEVDSMQIARALSEIGPDHKAVADMLEKIDGSFALVWVDRRDSSVNMCRNSSRPIHFGFNSAKDIMWFMSDGNHLKAVTGSLYKSPSKVDTIYALDKHKLLKFKKGSLVPGVTTFRPFVRPTYTHPSGGYGTTTTREHGSALKRAADRWQDGARKAHSKALGGRSTSSTEGKCLIGQEQRVIPTNHTDSLHQYFELKADDLLEFSPEEWIEYDDKKCMVYGTFMHPDWMYTEWPCVLYDVPLVVCNAYKDKNWAVRAKGITETMIAFHSKDVVSLLGELYAYDADKVFGKKVDDDGVEYNVDETETNDTGLVTGPEERLMERGKVMELLKDGCVQCGADIEWEERANTMIVNEGRSVLCPGCHEEWRKEA